MKKLTLLLICIVGSYTAAHAQIEDYISETRGDTVVVKTWAEMEYVGNALPDVVAADTDAPDGRVYELKQGGYYPVSYQISVTGDRPLVIAGEDDTPHVMSTNETSPPVIHGEDIDGDFNGGFINFNTDVTIKNLISGAHSATGSQGWSYSDANASGITFTMDNVYMEHTNWIFVQSNGYPGNSLKISDSYFVNMNGNGCRRNGGVYDNTSYNTDEMWVENSTHVMGAGMIYKFRSFPVNKVVFNHNTFVNISNAPISTMGYQTDMIVTNNLFVNTNVQAYYPGLDGNETDQDNLPTGIINVDSLSGVNNTVADSVLSDDFANADPSEWPGMRKILVDGNAAYWSPELDDIVTQTENAHETYIDTVAGGPENGELINSMMTMNARTQAMFDNDEEWPYLAEGAWLQDGDPGFTEGFGLLDATEGEPLANFIEYTIASLDGGNALVMTSMRTEGNPPNEDNFAFPDWPIPVDLSYSNQTYLEGGYNGLPVGDLNWFPDVKETWDGDAEYTALNQLKENGQVFTSNEESTHGLPKSIKLKQNYPNPFNPTTNISFELPSSQRVTLKVYDMLGREVATLMNNELATGGVNSINFNASNLASGVYLYMLTGQDFSVSKSMTLIK